MFQDLIECYPEILLTELQGLLYDYEITNKTKVFKIPYYSKYKHGYTFDPLIYLTCICKISLVVKIAIFGCFKFSKGY